MDTFNRAYYMGQRKRTVFTIIILATIAIVLLAGLRGEFALPTDLYMAAGLAG